MAYQYTPRSGLNYKANSPSPLRHASNASTSSSAYSNASNPFPPSRTSTVSSNGSNNMINTFGAGHKRGYSEAAISPTKPISDNPFITQDASASGVYKTPRQSLRTLPQAPAASPPSAEKVSRLSHTRAQSVENLETIQFDGSGSPPPKSQPHSLAISRSDSVRAPRSGGSHGHFTSQIDRPDLESMQKSSTSHLRTLSKFAESGDNDFSISSPAQEVVGMHGRRRLQRTASQKEKRTQSSWSSRNWMDQQRQFLQAYEYLCHIGEAKEWIEDIIHKPIPPIVQMEEALRDGVTLAEIVQALHPERSFRIFRNPKLQFRHSDNIAMFFRFLSEVELPELFRFELVDLYEKKNIPKVIYCIHALSWLLFRKGIVDFRIGNLVGQLQFEEHELEAMQKGLDNAGISLPNFSGMGANFGAEPEPEPEESEEERIDRELAESEPSIADLQAQIRGAIARLKLGDLMQQLWDSEPTLIDLQSRIRGIWAREVSDYKLEMQYFAIELQSVVRGYIVRSKAKAREEYWQDKERQIVTLQCLVRARKARNEIQTLKTRVHRHEGGIRELQAAIRGALARRNVGDEYEQTREAEAGLESLQAAIRGALARKRADDTLVEVQESERSIDLLQAAVRGMFMRKSQRTDKTSLRQHESSILFLQSASRGLMARKRDAEVHEQLVSHDISWSDFQSVIRGWRLRRLLQSISETLLKATENVTVLQSVIRGAIVRSDISALLDDLRAKESLITHFQATIRGHILRSEFESDMKVLQANKSSITELQAACRAFRLRQKTFSTLCELNDNEPDIINLQGLARAVLQRKEVGDLLARLDAEDDVVCELQTLARGSVVRKQFAEKRKYYHENMQKVIKIQSFIRAKQQGEAYKSLTGGKNPPVGTIKNFVHLLNDSDFDFDEEIEFERLRKTVVQQVRQNEMAEQYIDQLDIKIALLVKNKITLDEVVRHQKHYGGHVGNLLSNKDISSKDPFDLKALNKNSRKKLEHYQELFFTLQTQPQYLARLFKKIREQSLPEKESKRIEQLMMVLFGFAQKRREEYYLLKLVSRSIKEEVDNCQSVQDYIRGSFFWNKLLSNYIRSPRDRKFLKELLGPLIKENIVENEGLDLESDPMQIYRAAVNNEELRTGRRSQRIPDIPREEAIKDPETRETFISHLQDLRDIADQFFAVLEDLLHKMPYGIRFVAQQTFSILREKFQREEPAYILQVIGNWIWKTYLQPAIVQPEVWGIVDRGLSPLHKRNLGEVAKVLGQVSAGRLFGGDNVYLQPLNNYVTEAISRLESIWSHLISIPEAESHFDISTFNDLYARTKPTLYIKLADIFAIHHLLLPLLPNICPSQDDVMREVLRELGSAKSNESELTSISSTEICLTLSPKLHDAEDPEAAVKALFMETKRCALYIIRVQTGQDLLSILVQPITHDDEEKWAQLVREELASHRLNPSSKNRAAYTSDTTMTTSPLHDLNSLTYAELKRIALENILQLERASRISRHNHYQDLLNAIAIDIRTKHKRRLQRAREMEEVRATLSNLDEKARWLDEQLKSYNDYIEQAMVTLQNKKGKKRFLLPFTKQYNHERELQRAGRVPKFGSFKYSARALADKGVLVHWQPYTERQWEKLDITISSNSVGMFTIEGSAGSMMIPGASADVPLDGLLQAQFDNHMFMNLFQTNGGGGPISGHSRTGSIASSMMGGGKENGSPEGALRLNVNLFLHLVFKKFYREE